MQNKIKTLEMKHKMSTSMQNITKEFKLNLRSNANSSRRLPGHSYVRQSIQFSIWLHTPYLVSCH